MMGIADHDIQTLTQADIAYIPRTAIVEMMAGHPTVAQAFWRQAALEASIAHEWMVNIGRRNAVQRLSHFICEFAFLQKRIGLVHRADYHWPLTQEQIGDVTGLTPVHVNRTMQRLRNDHLVRIESKILTILDWDALRRAGGFRPAYLHPERWVA